MENVSSIVDALFISEWDGDIRIETPCKANQSTKEVFDIEVSNVDGLEICTGEYVKINDIEYPVYQAGDVDEEEDDVYWYWYD